MLNNASLKKSYLNTLNGFRQFFPILIGILMLTSIAITAIPKDFYNHIFIGNYFTDPLFGAIIGSLVTGNPMNSYIIGGELLKEGVSLIAVTSFIISWTTVGIIQLPAEILMLGKRFAITRNIISFLSAILIAIFVTATISLI